VFGHVSRAEATSALDQPTEKFLQVFCHPIVDYQGYDAVPEIERGLHERVGDHIHGLFADLVFCILDVSVGAETNDFLDVGVS